MPLPPRASPADGSPPTSTSRLGADRALVPEARSPRDPLGRRPGAMALRLRRAERGRQPGRRQAARSTTPARPTTRPARRPTWPSSARSSRRLKEVRNSLAHALPRQPVPRRAPRAIATSSSIALKRTTGPSIRDANIPRETALAELEQQYQKIIGAMTVEFRGKTYTKEQMAPFLEETDRALREEAWRLVAARRLPGSRPPRRPLRPDGRSSRRGREGGWLLQLRRIRVSPPRPVRLRSRPRPWRSRMPSSGPSSPSPAPSRRGGGSGSASRRLRPWDLSVDPLGRPPLRPFDDPEKLADGSEAIFRDVDPELGRPVRLHARAEPARPRQPQGQGPRRLSDDA